MGIIIAFLLLGPVTYLLGTLWDGLLEKKNRIFTYIAGFFTMLGMFELLGVPMVLGRVRLFTQSVIYVIVLMVLSGIAVFWLVKQKKGEERKLLSESAESKHRKGKRPTSGKTEQKGCLASVLLGIKKIIASSWISIKGSIKSLSKYERIYLIVFSVLLGIQLYGTIFYDMGWFTSDDEVYVAVSTAAIHDGQMFMTSSQSGDYSLTGVGLQYMQQAIYVFYTFYSYVTGIAPAIMQHTVFPALFLLFAYGSCWLLSCELFKELENRLIFLILIAVLYLFGKYTHYSVTFRLIGPINQGKAVLAVVVLPFILWLYPKSLCEAHKWSRVLFFAVISLAAVSFTMGGVVMMFVVMSALTFLHYIKDRNFRNVLYFAACLPAPAFACVYYLINR